MATAILTAAILHLFLPPGLRPYASVLYPVGVIAILVVLVIGDPGRINERKRWLAILTGTLIGLMTVVNAWVAIRLLVGIIDNATFTQPVELLVSGGIVWLTNVIVFALWFWDLDRGGAAARAHGGGSSPALIFPEMTHTEHVPEGWYPEFVDYLAFSFSTATAFSPTDVSAVKRWAKALMVCESLLSLVLAALVIARAINILN